MKALRRFVHWRLTKARRVLYGATIYRRQFPERYAAAKARTERWERVWLKTYLVPIRIRWIGRKHAHAAKP